ncbi:GyrI-like domain-containing protein [Solibacillus sp. CAU 1738]|uniref:GyrI-like domain-containing protein n=1 Tax=Solibacillus sp. CAU 1738 TaxID=3140363 RepID=UPI003260482B
MTETSMQMKSIKQLGELKLVGFRVLCAADQYIVQIPKASVKLSERISEIKHAINPMKLIGAFVVDKEFDEQDGYWVCVEVQEFENIPTDMVVLTIPSQKYAVLRHRGKNEKIMDSYQHLHKWIEEKNYVRLKNKWHLEIFHSWENSGNIDVELFDTIDHQEIIYNSVYNK